MNEEGRTRGAPKEKNSERDGSVILASESYRIPSKIKKRVRLLEMLLC